MTDQTPAPAPRPRLRIVAALLSLIAPGVGHVYIGRTGRGLVLFGIIVAIHLVLRPFGTLLVPPHFVAVLIYANVLALGTIAVWLFAIIDAARLARRSERGARWFATLGAIPAVWLCLIATGLSIRLTVPYLPWRTFSVPSTSMQPTPRQPSSPASARPTWPPPTIRTGTLRTGTRLTRPG